MPKPGWDKSEFSGTYRATMSGANMVAALSNRPEIGLEDMVVAVADDPQSIFVFVLRQLGVSERMLVAKIASQRPPRPIRLMRNKLQLSRDARKAIQGSLTERQRLLHPVVDTGHLLLATLVSKNPILCKAFDRIGWNNRADLYASLRVAFHPGNLREH